jgi:hypothetical protein
VPRAAEGDRLRAQGGGRAGAGGVGGDVRPPDHREGELHGDRAGGAGDDNTPFEQLRGSAWDRVDAGQRLAKNRSHGFLPLIDASSAGARLPPSMGIRPVAGGDGRHHPPVPAVT